MCTSHLILAVFRLAVADFLGTCYGHDEPGPDKRTKPRYVGDAETFLRGSWAAHLGDLAGFPAEAIWCETRRLRSCDQRLRQAA